jgi:DNA-binding transcriptional MerR regulator
VFTVRIGELARGAGVTIKTVRYYESLGLLSVARAANGYRDYDDSQVELVREIHSLGELGIRVDQSRPFLDCLVAGNEHGDDCAESLDAYRSTIDVLDRRIEELSAHRDALLHRLTAANERQEPICQFSKENER